MPQENIDEIDLFEELDSMSEYDFWELVCADTPELPPLTPEEEKSMEEYELKQYEQTQQEFDDEFEDNLNVKKFELSEREEFDPTKPEYYL